ncbi:MAG: hypothetical protein ACXABE_15720 [Candidatus Thorarchaeota archaeon]|jgi:hypothetical protein
MQIESILFSAAAVVIIFVAIMFALYVCCTPPEDALLDQYERGYIPHSIREEFPVLGDRSEIYGDRAREQLLRDYTHRKRPIAGVSRAVTVVKRPPAMDDRKSQKTVKVKRGGEFLGNRMRFKVKVLNQTEFTITDVTVFLISYPSEALKIDADDHSTRFPKIEPEGFRSPSFDFLPTQDCVKGEVVAGVSYIDHKGTPHTLNTKPFVIRSVCDLLMPDKITAQDFELKLKELECGELIVKVAEWSPEEMHEKSLRILSDANFFEVSSELTETDGKVFASITGFAKGKYTGKQIGAKVNITGPAGKPGASCTIQVSGEDQAMILPAIDDLRERLSAWLCPNCSSPLTLENVDDLRLGKTVSCPFCGVSIGR